MRVKPVRFILATILAVNIIVLYYLYHLQQQIGSNDAQSTANQRSHAGEADGITFIIREFEDFDNEVLNVVTNIAAAFPSDDILVVMDKTPYPPIDFKMLKTVKVVKLNPDEPSVAVSEIRPETYLKKKNVVLIPDGVRITDDINIRKMIELLHFKFKDSFGNIRITAAGISPGYMNPAQTRFLVKEWTVQHSLCHRSVCDSVLSDAVIAMRRVDFINLTDPFIRPVKNGLFVQTVLRKWKVFMANGIEFKRQRELYTDNHFKWKHENREEERLRNVYDKFGIKRVVELGGEEKWFGCSKSTSRCFGTVIKDMPEFLYRDRWTPPCCLKALRETAAYVFRILEESGVRYWLEGGSLLGAARNQDIIPWDYDIDIGIYLEDLNKCKYLENANQNGGLVDENNFVWERTDPKEGDFFRVQFSETNHMHVDIFPFFSKNGIMTKKYWMKTHRQDREFPERFLQPLTKVKFAGLEVSAPNNVREFLEFKFGAGVIESPQLPNSNTVRLGH